MKKQFLLLLLGTMLCSFSYGQTQFGAGVSWLDGFDIGLHARAKLNVGDEKMNVIPIFTYWLKDGSTVMSIDANVTYDLVEIADFPIYALGGLDWSRTSVGNFSDSNLGLNLGAGTIINSNIYGEFRWTKFLCENCGDGIGVNLGYYF